MSNKTRRSIAVVGAAIAFVGSVFTAATASAAPADPVSPSSTPLSAVSTSTPLMTDTPEWTKTLEPPASTDGAVSPNGWTNEYCVGNFAQPSLEVDGAGAVYLHFGGIQQCAPSPQDQSLEIELWNADNGDYVRDAYSGYHVANTVTAYAEPTCDTATPTSYYMKAYGFVEGYGNMIPYPAISEPFAFNCFIAG